MSLNQQRLAIYQVLIGAGVLANDVTAERVTGLLSAWDIADLAKRLALYFGLGLGEVVAWEQLVARVAKAAGIIEWEERKG